jgi:hypothetical protein
MRQRKIISSLLFNFVFSSVGLFAQNVISTAGNNATGSGGTVNYSIGQVLYTSNTGINASATQGVQQPFEISVVTSIKDASEINLICSTYPNPSTDFVTLKIVNYKIEKLHYQLFDTKGTLIETKKIENYETSINMSSYTRANYFLKIIENNKELKVFKLIKK